MILHCNYEELRSLSRGAELLLSEPCLADGATLAPPLDSAEELEALLPRLAGDLSIVTLADQRRIRDAVARICDNLKACMDAKVIESYPGHEDAVELYFDYAHTRAVLERVDRLGASMRGMLELITGDASTRAALEIRFPD